MKTCAVIFDNDGVLVDSEQFSLLAYREAIREQGVELQGEDDARFCGLTDADIIREMRYIYNTDLDLDLFSERKRELYAKYATKGKMHAFPGVTELLASLNAEGVPYAIASSGSPEKIAFNLNKAGLEKQFDLIISGDDFQRGKPDPEIFLCAANRLGIPPEKCVVIEDSINGLKAARAAKTFAIGITNTFASYALAPHADLLIRSMAELDASRISSLVP